MFEWSSKAYDPPNVEMKVIDGAAFVNMNPPTASITHGEYCDMELKAKVLRITDGLQRVDIVFETYQQNTIKSGTRDSRGKGIRFSVRQYAHNKTEFQIISSSFSKINCPAQIITTKLLDVQSNCNIDTINLQPCNHEECI